MLLESSRSLVAAVGFHPRGGCTLEMAEAICIAAHVRASGEAKFFTPSPEQPNQLSLEQWVGVPARALWTHVPLARGRGGDPAPLRAGAAGSRGHAAVFLSRCPQPPPLTWGSWIPALPGTDPCACPQEDARRLQAYRTGQNPASSTLSKCLSLSGIDCFPDADGE